MFTPIDSDFCGDYTNQMSWKDYILIHKAVLRVVRETGGFWFSKATYPRFDLLQMHAPRICATMLKCMKNHEECEDLEAASLVFVERTLNEHAKAQVYKAFHNIGKHWEFGSVSSSVSAGKSVRRM